MAITQEQVFKACNKIVKRKEMPTIEKVRIILKTGSYSTITKYLHMWRMSGNPTKALSDEYMLGYNNGVAAAKASLSSVKLY